MPALLTRRPVSTPTVRVLAPALLAVALSACGSREPAPTQPTLPPAPRAVVEPAQGTVLGRNERVLVYMPQVGDTWAGLAARFLGDSNLAWRIGEANRDGTTRPAPGARSHDAAPQPGVPVAVPLVANNPLGVRPDNVQSIPILCYHRLGTPGTKMTITPQRFEAQLDWLAAQGWRVVRLDDVAAFMAGGKPLPAKSVVITFDDGYESVWRHAWPALRKRSMPSTLFVYSDFIGAGEGLSWAQMAEMQRSGLVDIQAHSKSHRNLADRSPGESDGAYRNRLDTELRAPRAAIERALGANGSKVRYMAYPYGDANEAVLDAMRRNGYELGLTVNPGVNPFYAAPLMLKRVMIYGDLDMDDFKARLQGLRVQGRL